MKMNFIPEGVADINYDEFEKISAIEKSVLDVFKKEGYRQILTPSFEFYDLFSDGDISVNTEDMYKIIDSNGKIMVLRPDATVPIARMAATHYKNDSGEIRLMYLTNVFRSADYRAGGKREFRQAGIECFGSNTPETDAGIILTAVRGVRSAGFDDLKTEIGNAEYFKGFMEELEKEGVFEREEEKQELRSMMETKNVPGIRRYCEDRSIREEYTSLLVELPLMYGRIEDVLEQASARAVNDRMRTAVENIRVIAERIGGSVPLTADMSLIGSMEYYSGMIFRIYLKRSGAIACSGGRYDGLLKRFGRDIPAAGFGLNIDLLYEASRMENDDTDILNIALGKGRLADITIEKFREAGIVFPDYTKESRKLIFTDSTGRYRIIFVKAVDVGIYVEKGACDVGVIGKDTLLESASDVFEMLDLGYGKCIFAVAAPKGFRYNPTKKLRVASKYPRVAKEFFARYGRSIEIIKINGSVELAPLVGLSDVIVDIVETGNTLKENGLEIVEPITDISARFIVNCASLKTKQEEVTALTRLLRERTEVE